MLTYEAYRLTIVTVGTASRVHAMTDKSVGAEIQVTCQKIPLRRICPAVAQIVQ